MSGIKNLLAFFAIQQKIFDNGAKIHEEIKKA